MEREPYNKEDYKLFGSKSRVAFRSAGIVAGTVAAGGLGLYALSGMNIGASKATCDNPQIKGNISFSSGEKIYHVPGGRFYDKTEIDTGNGERMFCTEGEAENAGWRKSSY